VAPVAQVGGQRAARRDRLTNHLGRGGAVAYGDDAAAGRHFPDELERSPALRREGDNFYEALGRFLPFEELVVIGIPDITGIVRSPGTILARDEGPFDVYAGNGGGYRARVSARLRYGPEIVQYLRFGTGDNGGDMLRDAR